MSKGGQKTAQGTAVRKRRGAAPRTWLGTEIELIIRERERLLQAAGAAATLFTALNIRDVPREAREPVRRLGVVLESLSEETLTDAIELLLGQRAPRSRVGTAPY
jgi:hypothetical protein